MAVSIGIVAGLFAFLEFVPFPSHFRAAGIVRATERTQVASQTAGYVETLVATPGSRVARGQPLLRLRNRELELELAQTEARYAEVEARLANALDNQTADLQPLTRSREAIADRIKKLRTDTEHLEIKARHDGLWVAPGMKDYVGRWLPRGSPLGLLVNAAAFEFAATVLQADADALFGRNLPGAEVRLHGASTIPVPVSELRVIPGEQQTLPSPALGWRAGGEVPVEMGDAEGNRAAEPFFEVIGQLQPAPGAVLLDGRSGKIRFDLEPEPLLPGWLRRLRQLLQKRYQI